MSTKDRVLILHGWGGSDFPHWQSHLASKIAKNYGTVSFPLLDNCHFPSKNRWIKQVKKILEEFKPTIVVCHSLANTLWFWLAQEELREIKQLVMVSPPSLHTTEKIISTFFPCEMPTTLYAKQIDIFVSNNDPWVTIEEAQKIASHYNASFSVIENGGHINADSGYGEFNLVEELLLHNI